MNVKFSKPIGKHYWINYLVLSEKPNTSSLCFFIFKFLEEKKLKMFRWKLFRFIIPNKTLLFKWKIVGNSLCNFCKLDEDSQLAHYVFTTLQFGCGLVRSLSYVKITLPQRILDTWYASRCDNVFSNVFVTYGYGLDANVKAQT